MGHPSMIMSDLPNELLHGLKFVSSDRTAPAKARAQSIYRGASLQGLTYAHLRMRVGRLAFNRRRRVVRQAINVFGNVASAHAWLRNPAIGLSGRRPVDVLAEAGGYQRIRDYLTQMEHCVYV